MMSSLIVDARRRACLPAAALACALLGAAPLAAQAQPAAASTPALSSPLGGGALPAGQGPGFHSPQSPIKPLPQRSDVVPWSSLTDLTKKTLRTRIEPIFTDEQKAMNGTVRRVQGFMVPMDTKPGQKHFLLTSVPLTCPFCIPGGPESMIEVKARTPVRYSLEPVVVEGRFQTLQDDQYGLFYRMVDAKQVD